MEEYWELNIILPNAKNQKIVNEYLLMLKNNHRSKRSVISYRYRLQSFFREIEAPISALTMQHVEQWLIENLKVSNENTSKNYLSILRSFFNYCVENGFMVNQPIPYMQKESENKHWKLTITLPNEVNQKVVNEYLLMLKNEQWSTKSILGYRTLLQSFFKEVNVPFSALSMQDIEQWLTEHKKSCTKKTIIQYLCTFRSFFGYCVEMGSIEKQPIPYEWRGRNGDKHWKLNIQLANSENQEVINDYLMSLKTANYSKESMITYRSFLQKFFKEKKETYSSLTSNQIQQWFIQHEKGFKEWTLKNHLIVLSAFYNFCVNEEYVDQSPIKSRMFPRLLKSLPKYLDREEIAKVRGKSENSWLRNRCIFEFLISSGCRIGEVYRLDHSKVDLENRMAMVLGKGKKYRQIHFSEKCGILLEQYLEKRTDTDAALFVSTMKKVNRLSIVQMRRIIKQLGEDAELSGSLYPHRLRHTFATDMLTKGADLFFIADELGHKDINTTEIYANLPKQELISLYRKYMG